MLEEEDWEVRSCGLDALLQIGEKSNLDGAKVAPLLEDEVYLIRAKACDVLGVLKASECVDQIVDLFEDNHASVRTSALVAAGAAGIDLGEEIAPKIYKFLNDENVSVRASAAEALGQLGDVGKCYAGVLAEILQTDSDYNVRCAILGALAKFGPYGGAFLDEITDCLNDPDPPVRVAALNALGQLGEEALECGPVIESCISDGNMEVANAAREALAAIRT